MLVNIQLSGGLCAPCSHFLKLGVFVSVVCLGFVFFVFFVCLFVFLARNNPAAEAEEAF